MDVRVYTIGNGISCHSCLGCWSWGEARRGCKRKAQNLLGSMPYTLFYKRTWGEDEIQYLNTSLMEYILLSASKEKY